MKICIVIFLLIVISTAANAECETCFLGAWNLESITDSDGVVTTPEDLGYYPQIQFLSDYSFLRMENLEIASQGDWWSNPSIVDNNVLEFRWGCHFSETVERWTYIAPIPVEKTEFGNIKARYR